MRREGYVADVKHYEPVFVKKPKKVVRISKFGDKAPDTSFCSSQIATAKCSHNVSEMLELKHDEPVKKKFTIKKICNFQHKQSSKRNRKPQLQNKLKRYASEGTLQSHGKDNSLMRRGGVIHGMID